MVRIAFVSAARTDFDMRGFAMSFWTLIRAASPSSFAVYFFMRHYGTETEVMQSRLARFLNSVFFR